MKGEYPRAGDKGMTIRFLLVAATYKREVIEVGFPPLGLAYIASSLREAFGEVFTFRVIDGNLEEQIKLFQPHIVGISSTTKNYGIAKEHARKAKEYNLPVVIGGVHISFMPQNLTEDMDVGVSFEGEITIVDLMRSFLANGRFNKAGLYNINGLIFRDNGELVITKPREFIQSLDTVSFPARDLLEVKESTSMLTSRGCPHRCAFCSTSRLWGNRIRYASAEYVAEEIELIYKKYGSKLITIYDDMFTFNSRRIKDILSEFKKKSAFGKVRFQCNIRTDVLTEEIAEIFHEMNVEAVGLGMESGSQKIIDYLKTGGITVGDNAKAIAILRKYHIIPYCSFILGSPPDDKEAIAQTLKFIKDNRINNLDFHVLTPYPGTPVWDYAKEQGLVNDNMDWSILNMQGGPTPQSIIFSGKLSREEVISAFQYMENRKEKYQRRVNMLIAFKRPRIVVDTFKTVFKEVARKLRG